VPLKEDHHRVVDGTLIRQLESQLVLKEHHVEEQARLSRVALDPSFK
jgi:hypothetical protein